MVASPKVLLAAVAFLIALWCIGFWLTTILIDWLS